MLKAGTRGLFFTPPIVEIDYGADDDDNDNRYGGKRTSVCTPIDRIASKSCLLIYHERK